MTEDKEVKVTLDESEYLFTDYDFKVSEEMEELDRDDLSVNQYTGSIEIEGEREIDDATITVKNPDGTETVHEDCRIETTEQRRERAEKVREQAPDEKKFDRTHDIDDLIEILQEAKERGVEKVEVNDDGVTRTLSPRITNNMVHYRGHRPEPEELYERLEL